MLELVMAPADPRKSPAFPFEDLHDVSNLHRITPSPLGDCRMPVSVAGKPESSGKVAVRPRPREVPYARDTALVPFTSVPPCGDPRGPGACSMD
jgi:hypothetical protein